MRKTTGIMCILAVAVLAASFLFMFAACSGKDDNKLYVGLECAYSPFNYTQRDDSDGAVQIYNTNYSPLHNSYANGYDVMIAKKIAEALGKELVVVKMEWDSLIPALNAGTVDLVIAGMSPTEERKQQIDFSEPYYQSNLVLVVRTRQVWRISAEQKSLLKRAHSTTTLCSRKDRNTVFCRKRPLRISPR